MPLGLFVNSTFSKTNKGCVTRRNRSKQKFQRLRMTRLPSGRAGRMGWSRDGATQGRRDCLLGGRKREVRKGSCWEGREVLPVADINECSQQSQWFVCLKRLSFLFYKWSYPPRPVRRNKLLNVKYFMNSNHLVLNLPVKTQESSRSCSWCLSRYLNDEILTL